jgi:hypothetical protein
MSARTEANRLRYSSGEACILSQASYRQVDYWERQGMLGPPRGEGAGKSGWRRGFIFPEIVLMRAYVLAADVAQVKWLGCNVERSIWQPLIDAYDADPQLEHVRLIVEPEGAASIARATTAPAALVINLCTAARQVRKREVELRWENDPGALLRDRARREELARIKARRAQRHAFEALEHDEPAQ